MFQTYPIFETPSKESHGKQISGGIHLHLSYLLGQVKQLTNVEDYVDFSRFLVELSFPFLYFLFRYFLSFENKFVFFIFLPFNFDHLIFVNILLFDVTHKNKRVMFLRRIQF